ncbi:hypothetical protein [Streptomyces rochei]
MVKNKEAVKRRLRRLAWVALEGLVGAGVGLMAVTLYLAAR